jgi:hypothetical protein
MNAVHSNTYGLHIQPNNLYCHTFIYLNCNVLHVTYYDIEREKLLQQIGYTWQWKGELEWIT